MSASTYAEDLLAALDRTHALAGQRVEANITPPVIRHLRPAVQRTLTVVGSIDGCLYGHTDEGELIGVAEWAVE